MPRYLMTGGAAFIGSHRVEALLVGAKRVSALDSLSTGGLSKLEGSGNNPAFSSVQGPVIDKLAVDQVLRERDAVVHLAAAVGVKLIVEQPLYSLNNKHRGCISVLEAAQGSGVDLVNQLIGSNYGTRR